MPSLFTLSTVKARSLTHLLSRNSFSAGPGVLRTLGGGSIKPSPPPVSPNNLPDVTSSICLIKLGLGNSLINFLAALLAAIARAATYGLSDLSTIAAS